MIDLIVKMHFGSHLYGTNTEDSDADFKGIYLPSKKDILLNRVKEVISNHSKKEANVKNTKEDVDYEIYSIFKFIELAKGSEPATIDMMHCPDYMVIEKQAIWNGIREQRSKVYSKKLNKFTSYLLKQCAKYSIKGSRLHTCEELMNFLDKFPAKTKMKEIWEQLPKLEHMSSIKDSPNGVKQILVVDKIIQSTTTCDYAKNIIKKYFDTYGERAKQARENKNIDLKAVSHACRYVLQMEELVLTGDIIFPLKDASFLRDIKMGKYNIVNDVLPYIENKSLEVQELINKSDLPEEVDVKFWDDFIYTIINERVINV